MSTPLPDIYEGDQAIGPEISERSRGVALTLAVLGGFLGLHRFYAGKNGTAVAQICTLGGLGVWWLYDLILVITGEFRDMTELPIRRWGVEHASDASGATMAQVRQLSDQMDVMQRQLGELAERLDFTERVMSKQRLTNPS